MPFHYVSLVVEKPSQLDEPFPFKFELLAAGPVLEAFWGLQDRERRSQLFFGKLRRFLILGLCTHLALLIFENLLEFFVENLRVLHGLAKLWQICKTFVLERILAWFRRSDLLWRQTHLPKCVRIAFAELFLRYFHEFLVILFGNLIHLLLKLLHLSLRHFEPDLLHLGFSLLSCHLRDAQLFPV